MIMKSDAQEKAEAEVRLSQEGRGPFVLACGSLKLPLIFTDATDPENRIVFANESMLSLLEYPAEELLGKSFYSLIATDTDSKIISKMKDGFEGGLSLNWEIKCRRKSGSVFRASIFVTPVHDVAGNKVQYFASFIEHEYDETHWKLIIDELNHRVKNTLTMVQAIVNQALASKSDRPTIRKIIESRLSAFARSHDLLARENWINAGLCDIISNTLEPFNAFDGGKSRIEIKGDNLRVRPKEALALCMVFHELATNALKYGALLSKDGKVHIDWKLVSSPAGQRLRLCWCETGGPPVKPPTRHGFGSQMINRGLAFELNGTGRFDYRPDGLVCEIDIPAPVDARQGS